MVILSRGLAYFVESFEVAEPLVGRDRSPDTHCGAVMAPAITLDHGQTEHSKRRQFRPYNVLVIFAMSFGSISMGYSASIIGSTLGKLCLFAFGYTSALTIFSTRIFHQVFQARHQEECHKPDLNNEWPLSGWRLFRFPPDHSCWRASGSQDGYLRPGRTGLDIGRLFGGVC